MPYKDPEKARKYLKEYNFKRKDKQKEYNRKYHLINGDKVRERNRKWYSNLSSHSKEKMSEKRKKWNLINRDKVREQKKEKRKTNLSYRLSLNLRRRILHALKGNKKSNNTMTLLGIPNSEFLWNYLESTFKPGMTRENHGKWHVDHIRPCSSFDLSKPEEQAKCFHYTNLQALWAYENLSKGSKYVA